MDSALAVPRTERALSSTTRRLGVWVVAIAFAAYGLLLATHLGAYAGGSDSSGYMNHARLLGLGHLHVAPRTIPELAPADTPTWLYSALGFKPAANHEGLVPTYPVGLPLFILGAAKIVGWAEAGNVVLWLHGMAGVVLMYAAGRTFGLSRRWSVAAAVILAASPLYLFMTLQAMSDVPAYVWTTASVLAAWHSRRTGKYAWGAGACFAVAVLIRPTDVLAIVPVAIALGTNPKLWLKLMAGGAPGAVFFAVHSYLAYGSVLTTGYGQSHDFGLRWVVPAWLHYAHWLPILFTPAIFGFVGLPFVARKMPRAAAVLGSWGLVFLGFYSVYYFTHEWWWYLRFLLPAMPALVIGSLLVWRAAIGPYLTRQVGTVIFVGALVGAVGASHFWTRRLGALTPGDAEVRYVLAADWAKEHLPANAVIAAMQESGALFYGTEFTFVRWDWLNPAQFAHVTAALAKAHRPLYAILFPFEIDEQHAFTEHMAAGHWTQISSIRDLTIWRWSPESESAPSSPSAAADSR